MLCYRPNDSVKGIKFGKYLLELTDNKISLTPLGLTTSYSELTEVPKNMYIRSDGITAGLICSRSVFNAVLFEPDGQYLEQLDVDFEI